MLASGLELVGLFHDTSDGATINRLIKTKPTRTGSDRASEWGDKLLRTHKTALLRATHEVITICYMYIQTSKRLKTCKFLQTLSFLNFFRAQKNTDFHQFSIDPLFESRGRFDIWIAVILYSMPRMIGHFCETSYAFIKSISWRQKTVGTLWSLSLQSCAAIPLLLWRNC